MSHETKLQHAIDWLQGKTSPKREKSRFWKDQPVRKGCFEVPVSQADALVIVSTFYGRRLGQ